MVVCVVRTRDRRGTSNLVRLTAPAVPLRSSSSAGAISLSRGRGRPLHVTSPPPPASIGSACWEPRTLRSDGEDWEEVVVAAGDADVAPDELHEATEEHGVVFEVVPTDAEVRAAIASIKQVLEKAPVANSEASDLQTLALPISVLPSFGIFVNHFSLDSNASEVRLDEWTETARLVLNSSALLPKEHQAALHALRLLHEDASVQKMVMALSTDKAVWAAVLKNNEVQEFKRSFQNAKENDIKGSSTTPPGFMVWVLENTQAKIKEFLQKILGLVNMLFQAGGKNYDLSDDMVRMSFMLSVFVFIVVTIARIR